MNSITEEKSFIIILVTYCETHDTGKEIRQSCKYFML